MFESKMNDQLAELEKEYCPPIDTSLFSAIVHDFNLSDSESYRELRSTLNELKENALIEENTSFDPSGSSGVQQDADTSEASSDRAQVWQGESAAGTSVTEDSDVTNTSQDLQRVHIEDFNYDETYEKLSDQEQLAALKEMFPDTKLFDIEWTLKKAHFNFVKAVEELLNQVFLEKDVEDGSKLASRGVDGFSELAFRPLRRKKKVRKNQIMSEPVAEGMPDFLSSASKWERVKNDIDFLEQRTHLPRKSISSKYHACGASLSSTIAALIASEQSNVGGIVKEGSNSDVEIQTFELAHEFPSLTYIQILGLVHLSHASKESARELSHALVSSPSPTTASTITPQYVALKPSQEDDLMAPASFVATPLDPSTHASLTDKRGTAFTQAQSAYRKSKSNPLFGGAAAYYSQLGRDASASLRKHETTTADQTVASQSKPGEIDLHGVKSQDAVRISRNRVQSWWASEAEEWSRTGKGKDPLRIVTGQGHHSTGGKGVLGPAVFKALMADGWKVRMEQGYIVISGKARK